MSPRNEEQNQQIRDERREEILQAALKVFARKGLVAAKISDIATAAGLSHGLIYHYFKSKDEIFTELVEWAFDTSIGIFAYAAESEGDPLERLTLMTETILSGAFQGESPYYFLMIIQAYTSESVPQTVKDLVKKKDLLYQQYLIPLLIEGQKTGQVAAGDPITMAIAYLSLIQGLAIIKMQGGEEMSVPSADILLRLFQNPTVPVTNNTAISQVKTGQFGPTQLEQSWLVYQSQENTTANHNISRVKIIIETRDNQTIYRIVEEATAKGEKTIIQVRAEDWRPIAIQVLDRYEKQIAAIEYLNDSVSFNIPARKLNKTLKLKGDYYDINMLSYLFQAYPFGQKKKIQFNLVMDGRGGSPVGSFAMYVTEIGREKVQVPAGNYDCYKLEMGIAGMAGAFAAKYKYDFWYTTDKPHILVKFEDQQGRFSELLRKE